MKVSEENELRSAVADLVVRQLAGGSAADLDMASPDDFRQLIRAAYVVADEAGHSLHRWVDAGRHAGLSWSDVGEVLGVSRQAAQQRFARSSIIADPLTQDPDHGEDFICRTGMTAFNEVKALEEEGRKGNELVGAAPLKLFFVPRGRPWENIRVTALALRGAAVIKRYEGEGWTHAVTWYPFHYFTRPARTRG
jgi:hypothetical protein